jgi:hypothetical protein
MAKSPVMGWVRETVAFHSNWSLTGKLAAGCVGSTASDRL